MIITNIQHFCLHDGNGIRTTIFLKGCSIKCPWCANPENINNEIESYIDCDGMKKKYGYKIDINDLFDEITQDKNFYGIDGGVTFSGGEPLLQADSLEPLILKLKEENINICFETALFVPKKNIEKIIDYVDDFIVDIKILDNDLCHKILGGNICNYYNNINFLFENKKNVTFRIPLCIEYTATDKNLSMILDLIKQFNPKKIEIFKLHTLAKKKYENLEVKFNKFKEISDDELKLIKEKIKCINNNVEILKI